MPFQLHAQKRKAAAWEWDGVDIDESVKPKPNGDKVLSSFTLPCMVLLMLIVCVQKCKCKFCGDPFIGGPARIREHHTRDPASTHRYHLCTSKANAAIEFHAKCKAALDEKQAKQAKKEQHEPTHKQQQIAEAFVKEKKALHGDETPELQEIALRALSQVCGVGAAEILNTRIMQQ